MYAARPNRVPDCRDSAYAFGAARGLGVGTRPLGQRPTSCVEEFFIIASLGASTYPFCKIYWNSYQLDLL